MFSIFGKKKPSEPQPDDVIQGPADAQKQNGDDFIFVERKSDVVDPNTATGGGIYPPMPPASFTSLPYPPSLGPRTAAGGAALPINYLQDIPFELSPQLATKDRYMGTQMQVDEILALMTRQLSVDESAEEYTFALERSVQNECY
ncbi:uncharacterized protein LOC115626783 [Scaptodrosophila lebanonensis]|uniref:Uncharacterized protein LOC115626783 n=1 Tax=Drosophila lebanonensis TaxID=7225 RepID=A0A6J2TSJ0_DROLE|nr:uncharacterized protein LOC115626783 [Scaptodrosophila lebanonensis]